MTKIMSKARQLRLNYQAKLGRPVSVQEAAEAMGISRKALTRIERNQTEEISFDALMKLCLYYSVGVGDVLVLVMNGREEDQGVEEEDEDIECLEYATVSKVPAYSRHSTCIEPEGSLQPVAQAA